MSVLNDSLKDLANKIIAEAGVSDGAMQAKVAEVVFLSSLLASEAVLGKDVTASLKHLQSALLNFADKTRQVVVLNILGFFQNAVSAVVARALIAPIV
ncbi:MAG: hypothetical protein E6R03_09080 [Hyphomicrobiaceae bacterium]|nr:MAG: hypothetical protein E6R03_09080 [Hyphomicrobiaceae bacterium]